MVLQTERCILRPWTEQDEPSLYEYARDPQIGLITGWAVHTDVENNGIYHMYHTPTVGGGME